MLMCCAGSSRAQILQEFGYQVSQRGIFNGFPGDPEIAVGPNWNVSVCNKEIRFFTKSGFPTFSFTSGLTDFWSQQGATKCFDPAVQWDEYSQRFWITACEATDPFCLATDSDWVYIAVSDDENPNGSWTKMRISTFACGLFSCFHCADWTHMSVDDKRLTIFVLDSGITDFQIISLDKNEVIANSIIDVDRFFRGPMSPDISALGQFPSPVVNYGTPLEYPVLIDAFTGLGNANEIRLHALKNLAGSGVPNVIVKSISLPISYARPVTPVSRPQENLDIIFDPRIYRAIHRNGEIWAVHDVKVPASPPQPWDRTCVRAYRIHLNGWPSIETAQPTVEQVTTIDDPLLDESTFMGSMRYCQELWMSC